MQTFLSLILLRIRNNTAPGALGFSHKGDDVHQHHPNIIERAYELARESESLDIIKKQLSDEGYTQVDAHLQGPKIRSDLKKVMAQQPA
jgi:hypothetical protein